MCIYYQGARIIKVYDSSSSLLAHTTLITYNLLHLVKRYCYEPNIDECALALNV